MLSPLPNGAESSASLGCATTAIAMALIFNEGHVMQLHETSRKVGTLCACKVLSQPMDTNWHAFSQGSAKKIFIEVVCHLVGLRLKLSN